MKKNIFLFFSNVFYLFFPSLFFFILGLFLLSTK
jgi:hypothetical protein